MHLRRTTVFEILAEIVGCNNKLKMLCEGQPEAEAVCAEIEYKADQLRLLCQGQQELVNGLELEIKLRDAETQRKTQG